MLFKNNPVLLSQQAVYSTPLESAVVSVASKHMVPNAERPLVDKLWNVIIHNMIEGCFFCLFFTFLKLSFIGHQKCKHQYNGKYQYVMLYSQALDPAL